MAAGEEFSIPIILDLAATFVFAITGATAATRRNYDYMGVLMVGIVSAVGGSLLRDGLFLQQTPIAVTDSRYLAVIIIGCLIGALVSRLRRGIRITLILIDALGLGAYAIVGTQASLDSGIPALGAGFVGLINAVGGGILRDISIHEEPLVFKPGEHYAGASLAGIALFLTLDGWHMPRILAASAGITLTLLARIASVSLGLRTRPIASLSWIQRS